MKDKEWYQFFLNVGYGIWQNYESIDPTDEENTDPEYNYVDKCSE
ncbi:hypothetical protein [Chryseobacterium sp.]